MKEYIVQDKHLTILYIDEFDQLFKKSVHQTQISFRIMELADYPKSNLVLIGISNTLDLVYKLSQKYKHDLRHI